MVHWPEVFTRTLMSSLFSLRLLAVYSPSGGRAQNSWVFSHHAFFLGTRVTIAFLSCARVFAASWFVPAVRPSLLSARWMEYTTTQKRTRPPNYIYFVQTREPTARHRSCCFARVHCASTRRRHEGLRPLAPGRRLRDLPHEPHADVREVPAGRQPGRGGAVLGLHPREHLLWGVGLPHQRGLRGRLVWRRLPQERENTCRRGGVGGVGAWRTCSLLALVLLGVGGRGAGTGKDTGSLARGLADAGVVVRVEVVWCCRGVCGERLTETMKLVLGDGRCRTARLCLAAGLDLEPTIRLIESIERKVLQCLVGR